MAKTRITISLDVELAERIRQHAEQAGLDVSAYVTSAASRLMAEQDEIEARFSKIDAEIADVMAGAEEAEPAPPVGEDLTEEQRRFIEHVAYLMSGEALPAVRPHDAA